MEQNWNYDELKDIQSLMGKQRYSHSELLRVYDLYNRIFGTNKSVSSCGKCNSNKLKSLQRKYEEERKKRGEEN